MYGLLRGSVPAGSRSAQTSGIAFMSASGRPILSAPIEPYLKCSTGGLRIGVENESALPSSVLWQVDDNRDR